MRPLVSGKHIVRRSMKKLFYIAIGLIFIGIVVFLGIKTTQDTSLVVWFGLASAIIAPIGLAMIGYGFRTDELKFYQDLSKVPEIGDLIEKAKTQEEQIALLEQERKKLTEIIQVEARRQTLLSTKEKIENELNKTLKEYNATLEELKLIDEKIEESAAVIEMKKIQKRINERSKGRVIVLKFWGKEIAIPERKIIGDSPLDLFLLLSLRSFEKLQMKFLK